MDGNPGLSNLRSALGDIIAKAPDDPPTVTRCVELFGQMIDEAENVSPWISIKDQMPKTDQYILFAWKYAATGITRVSSGSWIKKHTVEPLGDQWEEDLDYIEETDKSYRKEGWYEWGWDLEFCSIIDQEVTHWMPAPQHPDKFKLSGKIDLRRALETWLADIVALGDDVGQSPGPLWAAAVLEDRKQIKRKLMQILECVR